MPEPEIDIATLSPEAATAMLATMAAAYRAGGTQPPGPGATPGTPPAGDQPKLSAGEARTRLDALSANPEWASRYMSGDTAARREFGELTSAIAAGGDAIDLVLAGISPSPGEMTFGTGASAADMAAAVPDFRAAGLSDDVIRQIFEDRPVTPIEQRMVADRLAQRQRDPEWCRKLLAGDPEARRELTLISVIQASEVAA